MQKNCGVNRCYEGNHPHEERRCGPFWEPESPEWVRFWLTRYSPAELKDFLRDCGAFQQEGTDSHE